MHVPEPLSHRLNSMSAPTTSPIVEALNALADTFNVAQYADQCAIGVWTDDPAAPGCSAVVFQGKLYALVIPDAYSELDPADLSALVSGVISNAWVEWHRDHARLVSVALSAGRSA